MKTAYILAGVLALTMGVTGLTAQAEGRGPDRERASFSELDANGDGEVTLAEMQARGEARFAAADTDGNGTLSVEELIAARADDGNERLERRINRFIERADDNGDGVLDIEEMGPGEERVADRFERLDTDGSGGLSEEELAAARDMRHGHRGGEGRNDG